MDPGLAVAQLVLAVVSMLVVSHAEPTLALRELVRLVLELFATLLALLLPADHWTKRSRTYYLLLLALLLLVPIMGSVAGGARRWLRIAGIPELGLQPSALADLALILLLTTGLPKDNRGRLNWRWGLMATLVYVVLVALEPDLGSATMLFVLGGALLVVIGMPGRYLFGLGIGLSLVGTALLQTSRFAYAKARVVEYLARLTGHAHTESTGYQLAQAHFLLRSGGWWGHGFSIPIPPLPAAYSDMVFATLVYMLGWIGAAVVLAAYLIMLIRGLAAACMPGNLLRLQSLGVVLWLFIGVLVNLLVVLGLAPLTGTPFPLLSYGGSQAVAFGLGLGLLHRALSIRESAAW